MATYTDNYNLKKPATTDLYNIADDNGNMDIIDEAISNNEKALCRTNLLDNWYFPNPVNQRGNTSWDSSYSGYTVDRWDKVDTGFSLSLQSDGIAVSYGGTSSQRFWYNISKSIFDSIKGKKITISVLCKDVIKNSESDIKLYCQSLYGLVNPLYLSEGINTFSFDVTSDDYPSTSIKPCIIINGKNGASACIVAIKLEVGENQTLAREVNGSVILNDVPKYEEQLLRCKRFYQVVQGGSFAGFIYGNSSSVQVTCTLPLEVDMDESIASVTATKDSSAEIIVPTDQMTPVSVTSVSEVSTIQGGMTNSPTNGCYDILITPYSSLTSNWGYFIIVRKLKVILSTEE